MTAGCDTDGQRPDGVGRLDVARSVAEDRRVAAGDLEVEDLRGAFDGEGGEGGAFDGVGSVSSDPQFYEPVEAEGLELDGRDCTQGLPVSTDWRM